MTVKFKLETYANHKRGGGPGPGPARWVKRTVPRTDHTGRTFPTTTEMCRYWGIPPGTYYRRLENGWTLEDALLTPRGGRRGRAHG